ncbi:hypothetical protein [Pontimicrobium aquaticum]|uniref:Uncharacterized protein n=1 Tax=Pontimicrobium aquaticum TaxID=2565367 RepID=A0A4V5LQ03_9FLAO|nr:hypothetical protein [Pontimicrobium aquaticum]TJY33389.1 hypothetical protein E5167_12880 [Pontimicrobium aquaticum]
MKTLTIRKLSSKAEKQLKSLQKNCDEINTNSRAIEYVLERHYLIEATNEKNALLNRENHALRLELTELKNAFRTILKLTQNADL